MAGNKLTDAKLRNIAAGSNTITHAAVTGLLFKPSTSTKGQGAWIFRSTDPITKKRTKLTLGHYPHMSIVDAENEAKSLQSAMLQGLSPKLVKQNQAAEQLKAQKTIFKAVAEQFYEHLTPSNS